MSDESEIQPEDVLKVAQRALAKANENADLRETVAEIKTELTAMNLRLSEFDEDRPYRDLSRDDKIGIVREEAFNRAVDGRGRTLDYSDIRDGVFDGMPSPSYCYDLMDWAAQARGFEHRNPPNGNEHLYVDPSEARRGFAFYSAKKHRQGASRS